MRGEGNAARPRDHKVFFAGNPKSHATRQAIFDELKESPLFNLHGKALLPERYIFALKRHTYCLHLPGHATWSPRLIEYIWFGCIPVVVGSEYFLPLSGMVDWRLFSIGIGIEEISNLPELLQTVSKQRQQHLRNNLHKVAPLFMYHAKPRFGDAFYATLYQLYRRSRFIQRGLTKTDLYEFRHIARQQAKPYGAPHGGLVASYAYAPVCDLRLSWVYQTNDECKKGGKPYSITGAGCS
ncbi:hypothetical protein SARC_03997 [Sphaeroforma arctica JP610]|uniref:Exostosin GT47 domain-containing protein n=1 Tax=Sphaeroforma arctica JP610 TaxID=667725 RepID=A0A0L0G6C6_9EUKA|nr:hypothetical protein SARC_03997 [Sphaeroforma arctica JP610]KNC83773.1 hypothetical protein SARC_03997 [Sphaeroforma arctica JP610]|eukprot:XP_014157675.1 hypothetical protein SARC_03997 [Sphaeroforma arctica JP610]